MSRGTIPPEIEEFVSTKMPSTLLVRGGTGCGKTTFALELLRDFYVNKKGLYLYIPTRSASDKINQTYPWLLEEVPKKLVLPIAEASTGPESEVSAFIRISYDDLPGILRTAYNTLEALCDEMPEHAKNRGIIIDSWEALLAQIEFTEGGMPIDRLRAFILGLTTKHKVNLILMRETSQPSQVDYLVDGVANFCTVTVNNMNIREIELVKLRGIKIQQRCYLYSLNAGRFKYFEPYTHTQPKVPMLHVPNRDRSEYFSTGARDLDALLGGGYRHGTFNLLETTDDISSVWGYDCIVIPTIFNFVAQERGVAIIPSGGTALGSFEKIEAHVGKEKFDDYVRILVRSGVEKPYTVNYMGKSYKDDYDIRLKVLYELKEATGNKPLLTVIGYDTIETCYGDVVDQLSEEISLAKDTGDLIMGQIKPGMETSQKLRNMAEVHLKLSERNGTLLLQGIKPKTAFYTVARDTSTGRSVLRLSPIY